MTAQLANKAATTLNGSITNVATSLVVTSATGFPTSGDFWLAVQDSATDPTNYEILKVTAVSGTTFTVTREAEDSARFPKVAHGSGSYVAQVVTKAMLLQLFTDLAIPPSLGDAKGDLLSFSADNTPAKLTVGADGTRPEADSSQTTGIKWSVAMALDGWIPAGETWTYAAADSPTFTFTITGDLTTKYQAGQRLKLTQTTPKYFLVTKVAYSAPDTTVTIYGGTDYTLANAAITSPYYSPVKAPFGFPLDPTKWTVEVSDANTPQQSSPVSGTWYNLGSVSASIPIGVWDVWYEVVVEHVKSAGIQEIYSTLSTANNSQSDAGFTQFTQIGSSLANLYMLHSRRKILTVAAKTSYFLNTKTAQSSVTTIGNRGALSTTYIRARSVYL